MLAVAIVFNNQARRFDNLTSGSWMRASDAGWMYVLENILSIHKDIARTIEQLWGVRSGSIPLKYIREDNQHFLSRRL